MDSPVLFPINAVKQRSAAFLLSSVDGTLVRHIATLPKPRVRITEWDPQAQS